MLEEKKKLKGAEPVEKQTKKEEREQKPLMLHFEEKKISLERVCKQKEKMTVKATARARQKKHST